MALPSKVIREFDYRPHRLRTVFVFLLALAGAVLFVYFALCWDGPLDAGFFELTEPQARILFGILAVLSPLGLIPLGGVMYVAYACDRRVAITGSSLILPRPTAMGLSCDEIEIPLRSILHTSICDFIGSTKLLRIQWESGTIHIPSNMFHDRKVFADMVEYLCEAAAQVQLDEIS
jgi:hypothetical protein